MNSVAYNVRTIIKTRGLKQKYVAQIMGMTERKLSDVINGRKVIDEDTIKKLCIALEVSPNELFGYSKSA